MKSREKPISLEGYRQAKRPQTVALSSCLTHWLERLVDLKVAEAIEAHERGAHRGL